MSWKEFYALLAKRFTWALLLNMLIPVVGGIWLWSQSDCDTHGHIVVIILAVILSAYLPMLKRIWELEVRVEQFKKLPSRGEGRLRKGEY